MSTTRLRLRSLRAAYKEVKRAEALLRKHHGMKLLDVLLLDSIAEQKELNGSQHAERVCPHFSIQSYWPAFGRLRELNLIRGEKVARDVYNHITDQAATKLTEIEATLNGKTITTKEVEHASA